MVRVHVVTIPASGSATVTISTSDDEEHEADGSVTLTLNAGGGYTLGAQSSETATVTDNDDAAPDYTDYQMVVDYLLQVRDDPENTDAKDNPAHILKWNRVLAAIGYDSGVDPMPASEIHENAETWPDSAFKAASDYLKSRGGQQRKPEVTVTAGAGVTEGGDATFTVTADPAPAADLAVGVTVTAGGDYGAATGQRTVTVPASGSATFTVGTTDDNADEADGSVTATVNAGSDYTVSATRGAATVAVADDDDPPPTPVVSVTAGAGVTEGGDATFTVTASPAPAADLSVGVTVSASGDYGAATGKRTVTVPTTGSATLTVGTVDDSADEADGSVTATVNADSGYTVSSTQGAATVGVADNDEPAVEVTVAVDDASAVEGDVLEFRVRLSEASAEEISVRWYTAPAYHLPDNRASTSEYQSTEGEMVFEPGVTALTGEVWLEQDSGEEPDEYFAVEAFLPGSWREPDAVGTMTIIDDD